MYGCQLASFPGMRVEQYIYVNSNPFQSFFFHYDIS